MSSEIFVFQENIFPDNVSTPSTGRPARKPADINKGFCIGDDASFNKVLQAEFSKQQFKRIDWNEAQFTGFSGKESYFTPSRGNDWSVVVLPKYSSHNEFQSGLWHKILNQCCKCSKVVLILSLEDEADSSCCSPQELVANAVHGSLLCAQWEYPQCILRLIRLQTNDKAFLQRETKKVVQLLYQEVALGASKRMEIFVKFNPATGNLTASSHSYVKNPIFTNFLSEQVSFSKVREILPAEKNGVFLITGGLGSLGLISAHVLLDYGFRRIALISRSGKASSTDQPLEQALYEKQRRYGAIIKSYCCDVSKKEELRQLFETVKMELCVPFTHPLKGIVHSAGILRDGLLCSGKAEAGANDVWSTKIHSAAYLDELLSEFATHSEEDASIFQPFQCFITFSSLAAAVGNVGQSTYAAANRALEHIIAPREEEEEAATAGAPWNFNMVHIRWPGIIGSNMGKVFDASLNSIMMSLEQVSQFLLHLLVHWDELLVYEERSFTPIPKGLLEKMKGSWMLEKFLLSDEIVPMSRKKIPTRPMIATVEKTVCTEATGSSASLPSLEEITNQVRQLIINLLGAEEMSESIDLNLPLLTMGLDSILAAELALELSMSFQRDLPPTFLYSYPSIAAISQYLFELQAPVGIQKEEEGQAAVESSESVEKVSSSSGGLFRSVASTQREERKKKGMPGPLSFPEEIETVPSAATRLPVATSSSPTSTSSVSSRDSSSSSQNETNHSSSSTSLSASSIRFDEIGIIGIGFDFPNHLQSLSELFQLLAMKSTTVSQVSPKQLVENVHLMQYLQEDAGSSVTTAPATATASSALSTGFDLLQSSPVVQKLQSGHFLSSEQKETFDGTAFKVTANEAETMDLSQKLLLMNCRKALIDAGIYSILMDPKHPQHGFYKNMGVYVGIGGVTPATGSAPTPTATAVGVTSTGSPPGSVTSTPSRGLRSSNPATPSRKSQSQLKHSARSLRSPSASSSSTSLASHGSSSPSSQVVSSYTATANTTSVAAGRISFAFGLEGPCMSIDTACSSSFVALHAARRALQLGECNVAMVAGVNLLDEKLSLACAIAGMTSSDGLCHTFDASADGYGRSEGCGVILLKRKEDCYRDEQKIYGLIKGSAIQQDGASASLTAPNGLAQESVIKRALQDAKVTANQISLVEAHGTGTQYGDPVEIASLANVFGKARLNSSSTTTAAATTATTATAPLYISAIKGNIGHLEACAGIAGIFAILLSFQQQVCFPNARLRTLNPLIAQSLAPYQGKIVISSEAQELPRINHTATTSTTTTGQSDRFLAGISSFGYSGTIAHVILEEPEEAWKRCISTQKMTEREEVRSRPSVSWLEEEEDKTGRLLPPSLPSPVVAVVASSFSSERSMVTSQVKKSEPSAAAVMTSSSSSSDAMEFAQFFFGVKSFRPVGTPDAPSKEKDEAEKEEQEIAEPPPAVAVSPLTTPSNSSSPSLLEEEEEEEEEYQPSDPQLLWQFSGQGNLKVNTGRAFYESNETYRSSLQHCARLTQPWLDQLSFLDILYPDLSQIYSLSEATELISHTKYSQVILIALEYSLAQALFAQGQAPAAVTGHSLGEYTAAIIAGVVTLEEGLYLVSQRGRLIEEQDVACRGKMVAVRGDVAEMEKKIATLSPAIRAEMSIAGVNGYTSLVLSGSERAIASALKQWNMTTAAIPLAVKHAFHSPLLQAIVPTFREVVQKIHWKPFSKKRLAYFSTYLGREITENDGRHVLMTEEYWIGHMIERVNYVQMIEAAVIGVGREEGEMSRYCHLMEIGPEKVLMKLSQGILKSMQMMPKHKMAFQDLSLTNAAVLE